MSQCYTWRNHPEPGVWEDQVPVWAEPDHPPDEKIQQVQDFH